MEEEEEQVSWSEGYTLRVVCVCVCVTCVSSWMLSCCSSSSCFCFSCSRASSVWMLTAGPESSNEHRAEREREGRGSNQNFGSHVAVVEFLGLISLLDPTYRFLHSGYDQLIPGVGGEQ